MFKLVDNKHLLHKSSTVVLSVFLLLLSGLEIVNQYLPLISTVVPANVFPYITFGTAIAIGVGRYVVQTQLQQYVEEVPQENNNAQ